MLHRLFLSLTLLSVLVFPTCLSASEFPVENQLPLPSPASPTASQPVVVNLRIEGSQYTIFEGVVQTHSHNVTTELGGNHRCDGTNFRAHPDPVPATFTAALDDASKAHGFTFDGYDLFLSTMPAIIFLNLVVEHIGPEMTIFTSSALLMNLRMYPRGCSGMYTSTSRTIKLEVANWRSSPTITFFGRWARTVTK